MESRDHMDDPSGLDPYQSEFLAKDELVTIVPKISSEVKFELGTCAFDIPELRKGVEANVPLWVALELKRKNNCEMRPPAWLNEGILNQALNHEKMNPDSLLPLTFYWLEIAKLYLLHAGDDLGPAQQRRDLYSILRNLEDIRAKKIVGMCRTLDYLNLDDVPILLMSNVTSCDLIRYRTFLVGQVKTLHTIYKSYNGELDLQRNEDEERHDRFYTIIREQEKREARNKQHKELVEQRKRMQMQSDALQQQHQQLQQHQQMQQQQYQRKYNNNNNNSNNNNLNSDGENNNNDSPPFQPHSLGNHLSTPVRDHHSSSRYQQGLNSPSRRAQTLEQHGDIKNSNFYHPPSSPASTRIAQAALQSTQRSNNGINQGDQNSQSESIHGGMMTYGEYQNNNTSSQFSQHSASRREKKAPMSQQELQAMVHSYTENEEREYQVQSQRFSQGHQNNNNNNGHTPSSFSQVGFRPGGSQRLSRLGNMSSQGNSNSGFGRNNLQGNGNNNNNLGNNTVGFENRPSSIRKNTTTGNHNHNPHTIDEGDENVNNTNQSLFDTPFKPKDNANYNDNDQFSSNNARTVITNQRSSALLVTPPPMDTTRPIDSPISPQNPRIDLLQQQSYNFEAQRKDSGTGALQDISKDLGSDDEGDGGSTIRNRTNGRLTTRTTISSYDDIDNSNFDPPSLINLTSADEDDGNQKLTPSTPVGHDLVVLQDSTSPSRLLNRSQGGVRRTLSQRDDDYLQAHVAQIRRDEQETQNRLLRENNNESDNDNNGLSSQQ